MHRGPPPQDPIPGDANIGLRYRDAILSSGGRSAVGDDDAGGVLRDFFLGFVRLHVLHHAGLAPVCGVELMAELRRHGYTLGPGTVYPLLHRLEARGFLVHAGRRVGARWRKYYTLTARGAVVLAEARRRLPELVDEVLVTADAGAAGAGPDGPADRL